MHEDGEPLILLVDDDRTQLHLLQSWLTREGYRVQSFQEGESSVAALAHSLPDAVCLDLHMPGLDGIEVLRRIRHAQPSLPVLIMTSDTQIDSIVGAMREGAWDYLAKPINRNDLLNRLTHAVEHYRMHLRLQHLEREAAGRTFPGIIGRRAPMRELDRQMDRLTESDITVLAHGESGTGKELVARAIHFQSARKEGPFVAVNCAAIPETLQESELFGHEKGSFTGATTRRIGKFEQANRGSIFLDEIAELSLSAQAKLLRVLQERLFLRVGGNQELSSDFRLLAATHRDLQQEVDAGRFREDLYFRVAVFELEIPPLRERLDDLRELATSFVEQFAKSEELGPLALTETTMGILERYTWPGNVRELQNAMQRAAVVAEGGEIHPHNLPPRIVEALRGQGVEIPEPPASPEPTPAADRPAAADGEAVNGETAPEPSDGDAWPDFGEVTLEELEKEAIRQAMQRLDGNVSQVCRELGIGRTTLYRKLQKYELR